MASEVVSTRQVRLRDYRYPGEVLSLALTFIVLITLFSLVVFLYPETWTATLKTLTITLAGLAVYIISVKLQQSSALGTLVRVSSRQFPELFDLASKAAENLSSPPVPVYVKRASEMNIYTLGFFNSPIIVLTSSLVDQMAPDNLQFFIGREIGHVQASHTWLRTLLKPVGADVPVIGRLLNSVIFGDWVNRAELTADRAGFIACRSLTTSISTMLKFGIGLRLYEKLDIREFLDQINEVKNVKGHLTEIVAEQPYLTQRVRALVRFAFSDQFKSITPQSHGNTGILKDIPEAFISTKFHFDEILEQVDENLITVDDLAQIDLEDNNDFEADLSFVAKDGTEHKIRRLLTRLGRNLDNDIVVRSDRVSRYHAEIVREKDVWKIFDKDSRNGVWVNGKRIAESAEIKFGDVIRIGRQEYIFTKKD